MMELRQVALSCLMLCLGTFFAQPSAAQITDRIRRPDKLMVVLRETVGTNKPAESLQPVGKLKVTLDGQEREFQPAWFFYLGDMSVRFVFDDTNTMPNLMLEDLARLKLEPDQALHLAVANIKRVYGKPRATPWTQGLLEVVGESSDLNSSYFLD